MNGNNPTHYETHNNLQRVDTKHYLEKYGSLIKIKELGSILDIGCGDGYVTTHILGQYLGKKIKELVGIDISEKMIEHAENKYGNSENTECNGKVMFKVLDMMTKDVPKDLQERFDHAFSFYCFHWIRDFSFGLQNVKSMLKKRGDILFVFVANHPFFSIMKKLSECSKYAPYLPNFDDILPDYFRCDNKKEWCKNVFEENGFQIKFLEIVEREYTHPSISEYKETLKVVNTFKIPEELIDDYFENIINEMRKMGNIIEEDHEVIRDHYQVFIVSATSI